MRGSNSRKKSMKKTSNSTRNSSKFPNDKTDGERSDKVVALTKETKDKLKEMNRYNDELEELKNKYAELLGVPIWPEEVENNKIENNVEILVESNMNNHVDKSTLIETEDLYKQICIKMRQLIAGFTVLGNCRSSPWSAKFLPPLVAFSKLVELEKLRIRRHELIRSQEGEQNYSSQAQGVLNWIATNITSRYDSSSQLTAHLSREYTATTDLFDDILSSFDKLRDKLNKRTYQREIEKVVKLMKTYYNDGSNPNIIPDERIFRHLIKCYQNKRTLRNARNSANILHGMIEGKDEYFGIQPTAELYNMVLMGFNDALNGTDDIDKTSVLSEAEKIISLMEQNEYSNDSTDESLSKAYHTLLKILVHGVGPSVMPEFVEKVEEIMVKMIGEDSYIDLISKDVDIIDTSVINHFVVHDLLVAYTLLKDRKHLQVAKNLLHKMEKTRKAFNEQRDSGTIVWNASYPHLNSYNYLIQGHVQLDERNDHVFIDNTKTYSEKKELYEDAEYSTNLLDSMIEYESSLPQPFIYTKLLRLWRSSMSKQAGTRAEYLLSKMEICAAYSPRDMYPSDSEVRMKQKQLALECWAVSAAAGEPQAALNASKLLKKMETLLDFANDSSKKIFFYNAVINACADTKRKRDQKEATESLEIAFEMYNKLIEEGCTPTPTTFILLLRCCKLMPPSSKTKIMKLSREVFHSACTYGCGGGYILYILSHVNKELYESYEPKPEHSSAMRSKAEDKK